MITIKRLLLTGSMVSCISSCVSPQTGDEVRFRTTLPKKEQIQKRLFKGKVIINIPKGSKTSHYQKLNFVRGEAGFLRIKSFEGRSIISWKIRLYDSDQEQEYQTAEWIKSFRGKGVERLVPKLDRVYRFELKPGLRNYPGGEQSMFRYDMRSPDKMMTVRAVVYCLDKFCGSEAQKTTIHNQITEMLQSLRFTDSN